MRDRLRRTWETGRRQLYRSRHGIFLGICSGIAKRFDFSPWGMRLVLIVLTLFVSKWTILLYIAAAFVLKPEPRLSRFERYGF